MAVGSAPAFFTEDFLLQLDDLLFEICEDLQLSPSRYRLAEERYKTLGKYLEAVNSPFRGFRPYIYPQGSMRLNTTSKPISGPHDLDFVLELAIDYSLVDPMSLLRALFKYVQDSAVYRAMLELKNRCIRLEYADEFYMDVLPACRNGQLGGTCVKVPDRASKGWTDSDPIGYANWFEGEARKLPSLEVAAKAQPLPAQQAVSEKLPLQLAVQLLKRQRDLQYQSHVHLAPISVVLTTLSGRNYNGEPSVSAALTGILGGIVNEIRSAELRGTRVYVFNPSNPAEDLSERWDENTAAYAAFVEGIRELEADWKRVVSRVGNIPAQLERLFGEPVNIALEKQARRVQEARLQNKLAVRPSGIITAVGIGALRMRPNTYHGGER